MMSKLPACVSVLLLEPPNTAVFFFLLEACVSACSFICCLVSVSPVYSYICEEVQVSSGGGGGVATVAPGSVAMLQPHNAQV